MPPKPKKSPFTHWANATLTFTIDKSVVNATPVIDEFTGNPIPQKTTVTIKCILNPVRLVSAKRKDNNPGADTSRIGMSGYLVEPFLPNLPVGIKHNDIADAVIEVKLGELVIESKVGKFLLDLSLQSTFYVSPITGASVSGEFYIP